MPYSNARCLGFREGEVYENEGHLLSLIIRRPNTEMSDPALARAFISDVRFNDTSLTHPLKKLSDSLVQGNV